MIPIEGSEIVRAVAILVAGASAIFFGAREILRRGHIKQEIKNGNLPNPNALNYWLNLMEQQPGVTIKKFKSPK